MLLGPERMVSNWDRGGLGWIWGGSFPLRGWWHTEQVAQGGCGCPIPGGIQGQAGCGSGQPGLLVGNPAHSRGLKWDDNCGPFQPRPVYDSMMPWGLCMLSQLHTQPCCTLGNSFLPAAIPICSRRSSLQHAATCWPFRHRCHHPAPRPAFVLYFHSLIWDFTASSIQSLLDKLTWSFKSHQLTNSRSQ